MMGATTVCCLTHHIFLSAEQLLKTDLLSSLQAAMTMGDVFLIQNLEFTHP
jgi:hypothetical protein